MSYSTLRSIWSNRKQTVLSANHRTRESTTHCVTEAILLLPETTLLRGTDRGEIHCASNLHKELNNFPKPYSNLLTTLPKGTKKSGNQILSEMLALQPSKAKKRKV